MAKILVVSEQHNGKVKRVTLEALGAAARLASKKGDPVAAVLIGENIASQADVLAAGGAEKVYLAEDSNLALYSSEGYGKIVSDIAKEMNASLILLGATAMGKDLGPKIAAKLEGAFAGDCTGIELKEDGSFVVTRPIYGGKAIATMNSRQPQYQVVTLRPNIFPVKPPDASAKAVIEKHVPTTDFSSLKAKIKEVVSVVASKVELTEAQIIVSGGRGLKAPENFKLIEDLAEALGAAVGASRAAVDAGWKPHSYQVGLTGKTVSPLLYIACGISGAVQHLAGMSSAKYIVAINKDPNAPIFKIANYGIVGDLFEVIPLFIEEVKKYKHE
ncbi:electron transfer flavoprotein subunit alpha/FixB family protein [Nitrospira defluvii]|nr:electron transfer flavoprotein subunit alpha/FixB family protein [Nitrospira defluvii]